MAEMMRNDQTSPDIQSSCSLFLKLLKDAQRIYVLMHLFLVILVMGVAIHQMPKLKFVQFAEAKGLNNVYHAKDPGLLKVLRKLKLQYLQVWILEIQYVYQKLVILSDREINMVTDDLVFARDGADVYVNSNISLTQAILGGEVEVPTLSGKVQVKDCQSMVFYYIMEISMSASALICQHKLPLAFSYLRYWLGVSKFITDDDKIYRYVQDSIVPN
ncbi:hypothetical protein F3Y22_tig00117017pilonHSYRG00322 [Hibiscus syriacus]|uniref:Chaperone DnaJ C-terminal domain-containing protein n=1 Tax=Hibiscus syriacus TaxID=106335 RepID=A0A6A2XPI3_HIBSY|nr:hypothetical protein F3Y22_tig00117017pilonHSYRG00322 [Hibiscus syriacus]